MNEEIGVYTDTNMIRDTKICRTGNIINNDLGSCMIRICVFMYYINNVMISRKRDAYYILSGKPNIITITPQKYQRIPFSTTQQSEHLTILTVNAMLRVHVPCPCSVFMSAQIKENI